MDISKTLKEIDQELEGLAEAERDTKARIAESERVIAACKVQLEKNAEHVAILYQVREALTPLLPSLPHRHGYMPSRPGAR